MAALSSNKSSSSSIPGRANPSPRSSEIGNSMRRSFTGNPFTKPSLIPTPRGLNPNTPANSPSELPRKNSSVSRDSVATLRDYEDKENGKVAKLRSPMGSKGNGTKNFMSPTISAASKVNASPRKKILEERNEPVRASVSFSDFTMTSISVSSDQKKEEEEVLVAPSVSADSKAKSDSKLKKVVFVEPEVVNLEPSFKISPPPPPPPPSPSVPIIAPLDSDPLAPPYDPKTNYLSPRPRFLHYKPNPRVELYLSKTKEGKRLEDSFAPESFSDSDVTEEELDTQLESALKELEDDVSLGEDVRSGEKQEVEEVEEQEEELIVSEPSPIDAIISNQTVEAKKESTPHSVWRSKLTALLIILSIVCVSISIANLPLIDHSVFDGTPALLKQYDQSEIVEFVKASFDEMTHRFHVWYANSISSLSELISNLRGAHMVEPLHHFNLTALVEGGIPFADYEVNVFVPRREIIVEDKALQIDGEYEELAHQEAGEASSEFEEMSKMHFRIDSVELVQAASTERERAAADEDSEEVAEATIAEVVELGSSVAEKSQEENDLSGDSDDDPVPISQADEAQSEVSEAEVSRKGADEGSAAKLEAVKDNLFSSENPKVDTPSELGVTVDQSTEDSFSKVNLLGMFLLVLALVTSTGFVFWKKGNNYSTLNASDVTKGQGLVNKKKLDSIPTLYEAENTFEVRDCSGESCPSEMSSYHNTSFYENSKKGLNSLNEAQSYEKKTRKNQRRESMASSSLDSLRDSLSYGSFTTYEKITTKYGHGDEEVITPVRRSSRIRNNVTSP